MRHLQFRKMGRLNEYADRINIHFRTMKSNKYHFFLFFIIYVQTFVKRRSNNCRRSVYLEILKKLHRDHRTIKKTVSMKQYILEYFHSLNCVLLFLSYFSLFLSLYLMPASLLIFSFLSWLYSSRLFFSPFVGIIPI